MSFDGRDRTTSSQRSSMSDMSCCSRELSDVRQSESGKRLQPLTIPRHETDNPFLADPSPLGLAQLRKPSDADTSTPEHTFQLNLAASWDAAVASRTSPIASPGLGSLLRSQSEARQSPLRNCYSSTGHKSEAGLPVIMPSSPTPPSPSASQVSTPPLSARINSPFLSEGLLAKCACSRLSLDSSRDRQAETAHTALCNRVEAKLARARGEPLTPYLM